MPAASSGSYLTFNSESSSSPLSTTLDAHFSLSPRILRLGRLPWLRSDHLQHYRRSNPSTALLPPRTIAILPTESFSHTLS